MMLLNFLSGKRRITIMQTVDSATQNQLKTLIDSCSIHFNSIYVVIWNYETHFTFHIYSSENPYHHRISSFHTNSFSIYTIDNYEWQKQPLSFRISVCFVLWHVSLKTLLSHHRHCFYMPLISSLSLCNWTMQRFEGLRSRI